MMMGIAFDFWYIPNMKHLLELIRKRHAPGILILDARGRPCYVNPGAMAMLPGLMEWNSEGNAIYRVPEEIGRISTLARRAAKANGSKGPEPMEPDCSILMEGAGQALSVRAFAVGGLGRTMQADYVLVLFERVVDRHAQDFEQIKKKYRLSGRELDIIKHLCQGLSNREIAAMLFISEHTVKDHLKNIMDKMQVESRSEILVELRA